MENLDDDPLTGQLSCGARTACTYVYGGSGFTAFAEAALVADEAILPFCTLMFCPLLGIFHINENGVRKSDIVAPS